MSFLAGGDVHDSLQLRSFTIQCQSSYSDSTNSGPNARALRDMAMGLVHAFRAERGCQMAAQTEFEGVEQAQFKVAEKAN